LSLLALVPKSQPITQLRALILWLIGFALCRPKRDDTNPDEETCGQSDDDPFPAHNRTLSKSPQTRNAYSCKPPINTLPQQGSAVTGSVAKIYGVRRQAKRDVALEQRAGPSQQKHRCRFALPAHTILCTHSFLP